MSSPDSDASAARSEPPEVSLVVSPEVSGSSPVDSSWVGGGLLVENSAVEWAPGTNLPEPGGTTVGASDSEAGKVGPEARMNSQSELVERSIEAFGDDGRGSWIDVPVEHTAKANSSHAVLSSVIAVEGAFPESSSGLAADPASERTGSVGCPAF